MYPYTYARMAFALGLVILFSACKPESAKKITCVSTLHGHTHMFSPADTGSMFTCTHGIINTATGSITSSGSFLTHFYFTEQAAFNTSDNCYYIFKSDGSG